MFKEFHYQVQGRGHAADARGGQDRTTYLSRGGVQVMCLADGAGSALHSAIGAEVVGTSCSQLFVSEFEKLVSSDDGLSVKHEIVHHVQSRLASIALRRGWHLRDMAATLLTVAVSADRFLVGHVGDGVIGYVKDGRLRIASAPDNAEFANQTTFVTSKDAAQSMRLFRGSAEGVAGFILMSDGAAESLYDYRTKQLAPACSKMIQLVGSAPVRQVRSPAYKKKLQRLVDLRIREATKDDCSIAILGR